jgi:GntR family transcriptional repressor for pyruvate dehydrogenase complex
MNLSRIDRSDTISQILAALRKLIVDGGLEPGTMLPPERELSERLGVSRFSLREALRVMQAQGLVDIQQGRRPRVAEPSPDPAAEMIALTLQRSRKTLLDLVVARQGLEAQVARVAAAAASEEDLAAMQSTIDSIENNLSDFENCIEQDLAFHGILVRSTKNPVFEIMLAPLAKLLRASRAHTIRRGVDRVIDGHKRILAALRKRDPQKAAAAMHQHLEMAEEDLRKPEGATE